MEQVGIIILSGGKSSRMGEDKGLMTLFGKSMITYVIDQAREISSDILIVTNNSLYKEMGLPTVEDNYKGMGPLGGIQAGLSASKHDKNIILSCDIPYIKSGLIKFLLYQSDHFDITIPQHKEQIHPLMGIYTKKCLPVIESNIKAGRLRVSDVFNHLKVNIVDTDEFDDIEFKNLNSKHDIGESI